MKKLFEKINTCLRQGIPLVLCSILASSGSVPRGPGANMAVLPEGQIFGTIGGGSVEQLAIQKALEVHKTGKSLQERFLLHPNQVQDIGMVCGGEVWVCFQRFDPKDQNFLSFIRHTCALFEKNVNSWLIMELTDGQVQEFGTWDEESGPCHLNHLTQAELSPLCHGRAVVERRETGSLFVQPLSQKGLVYIFGGGHVGRALCPVLANLGFRVKVVESRPALCKASFFPGAAELIEDDCQELCSTIPITKEDYVVIMTPGHAGDRSILNQVLWTPARYIGVIGSRKKIASTNAWLLSQGHNAEALSRVVSPIGLPIGAETPEEIAISIAAQLISVRAGGTIG